jgi:hypothetical protein
VWLVGLPPSLPRFTSPEYPLKAIASLCACHPAHIPHFRPTPLHHITLLDAPSGQLKTALLVSASHMFQSMNVAME